MVDLLAVAAGTKASAMLNDYAVTRVRKIEETGVSPVDLLKNPNKIFFLLCGAVLLALTIIIVPMVLIVRHRRTKRKTILKGR